MLPAGLSRRQLLRLTAALGAGVTLSACQPKVVEKVVKETVQVEKVVKETIVVKEAVEVEKEVTRVVEKQAEAAPREKVTLRFQEKGPVQGWTERLVLPIFEDKHPWVDVIFEPRVDGWADKNLTQMAAGTAADIIHAWGEVFRKYTSKKQMLDIQPLVDVAMSDEDIADQHPFQWEAFWDPFTSVRFALARQVDMQIIYYNKDRFDTASLSYPTKDWTYDDWAEMLKSLVEYDASGAPKVYGGYGWLTSWTFMSCHVASFGGAVRDDATWTKCHLSEPKSKEYFEWMRARVWDDQSWVTDSFLKGMGVAGGTAEKFAADNFAMLEANLNSIGSISSTVPFGWDIAHVPIGPGGRVGLGDNDGYGIYKGVVGRGQDAVDAAWEFTKFMNGPIHQRINLEQTGECPGRRSLAKEYTQVMRTKFPGTAEVNLDVVPEALEMGYIAPGQTFRYQAEAQPFVMAALEQIWDVGGVGTEIFDRVCEEVNASQAQAAAMDA